MAAQCQTQCQTMEIHNTCIFLALSELTVEQRDMKVDYKVQNYNTGIRATKGIIQGVMVKPRPYLVSKGRFPRENDIQLRTERRNRHAGDGLEKTRKSPKRVEQRTLTTWCVSGSHKRNSKRDPSSHLQTSNTETLDDTILFCILQLSGSAYS